MGCCTSRPRGEQHEPQPGAASTTQQQHLASPSHALTPPVLRDPSRPTSSANSVATSTGARPPVPLDQHYNAPLKLHVWRTKASKTPWKRSRWLSKREEFFDTRVTNRPEIWESLKAVVELMDVGDLGTAQGILDASDITLPTGDLVDGAYDSLGNLYHLPHYAVAAPENLVEDDEEPVKKEMDTSRGALYQTLDPAASAQPEQSKEAAALSPASVPASTPASPSTTEAMIQVKARMSDRGGAGQDVVVSIKKDDQTKALIAAVATAAKLPKDKVRIAYMGKVLKPNKGFLAQGWQTGHVVNALVAP